MNPVPLMELVEVIRGIATDDATFDRLFDINVKGSFLAMREAAKRLRPGGRELAPQQAQRHGRARDGQHEDLGRALHAGHVAVEAEDPYRAVDAPVRLEAIRLAGEMGRSDLLRQTLAALADRQADVALAAAWSAS